MGQEQKTYGTIGCQNNKGAEDNKQAQSHGYGVIGGSDTKAEADVAQTDSQVEVEESTEETRILVMEPVAADDDADAESCCTWTCVRDTSKSAMEFGGKCLLLLLGLAVISGLGYFLYLSARDRIQEWTKPENVDAAINTLGMKPF